MDWEYWADWEDLKEPLYRFIVENRSMYRDDGTDVGLGDIIDFINATVTKDGRKITVDAHGWGGWPLYDYIVDDDWADTGLAEGTIINTYTGTKIYSTFQGALTAIDASATEVSVFICPGTYVENLTWPDTTSGPTYISVFGAGEGYDENNAVVCLESTTGAGGTVLSLPSAPSQFRFENVSFNGIIDCTQNGKGSFHGCRFVAGHFDGDWLELFFVDCAGIAFLTTNSGDTPENVFIANSDISSIDVRNGQANDWTITGCDIEGDIQVKYSTTDWSITGCYFRANAQVIVSTGAVGDGFTHRNWVINGNTFEARTTDAGVIQLTDVNGILVGVAITGNAFQHPGSGGGTTAYIVLTDGATASQHIRNLIVSGNAFGRDTSGDTIEDNGGVSVSGTCSDSVFGPNSPAAAKYNIAVGVSGIANLFLPASSATGTSTSAFGNQVKVSANDTTPDYLLAKLAAGTGITLTETNDAGDEDVTIAAHVAVTLGAGSDAALALAGQELTLADVLTPTEHTAIGNGAPHHARQHGLGSTDDHTGLADYSVGLRLSEIYIVDENIYLRCGDGVTAAFSMGPASGWEYNRTTKILTFTVDDGIVLEFSATGLKVNDINELSLNHGIGIGPFEELTEIAKPANPAANKLRVYAKDDGAGVTKLYGLDSAGTETAYGAGGGGGDVATDTIWAALGDTVYATANDTASVLPGNITTTKKFYTQTGDGAASAAPAWGTVVAADLPVGIADDKIVQIDSADVADNEYARFTAAGLESRSAVEVKQDLDLEDADITGISRLLDTTPDSDHQAEGLKAVFTAHDTQAFGDVCFINSDGEMALGDADAIASSVIVGMCADATINADAAGNYLLLGIARDDTWAWTVGGFVYLTVTGTTTNTLSQSAPTGTDDCIVIVGVATHADRMYFNPQLVIVEHT